MTLILLVDDDPLITDIVEAGLRGAGHAVGVLNDGSGVLDVVEFKRPALVILDCAMPQMPGIEVLRQIRSSKTSFGIPVLMLTGRDRPVDRDIAMRAGATSYMSKPFQMPNLLVRIDRMITESLAFDHNAGLGVLGSQQDDPQHHRRRGRH